MLGARAYKMLVMMSSVTRLYREFMPFPIPSVRVSMHESKDLEVLAQWEWLKCVTYFVCVVIKYNIFLLEGTKELGQFFPSQLPCYSKT